VGRGEAILKSADHPLEPQVTFPTANRERAHTAAEAERGRGAGCAKKGGRKRAGSGKSSTSNPCDSRDPTVEDLTVFLAASANM
jgi:hypothetical protein